MTLRTHTSLVSGLVGLCLLAAPFNSAAGLGSADAKCRMKIGSAARKLGIAVLKEGERCHVKRMLGRLDVAVDCNAIDQMPGRLRVERAAEKLVSSAEKHCAAAATAAENGHVSCPAPCASMVISDYESVGECLSCWAQAGAETVLGGIHGFPSPPAGNTSATKCLRLVGRALRTYADARIKVQQRCQYAEDRSEQGIDCLNDDSTGKIARARGKALALVARCGLTASAQLDSCAATVAGLQTCVPAAAEAATDSLFPVVYPTPGGTGDGYHQIVVPQPDGSSDAMTIYAVAPNPETHGDGPFPVIIYGHGQNYRSVANCSPDSATSAVDEARMQPLAEAGYLAIAVQYRNRGAGAPSVGSIRLREHWILDARGLLAAAQWARDEHGKGTGEVAFIGTSMGTWPAFWAASGDPTLADLQSGLAVRTVVMAAESANHFANTSGHYADVVAAGTPEANLQAVVTGGGFVTTIGAAWLGMTQVDVTDLAAGEALGDWIRLHLTEAGVELTSALFFEEPPAGVSCGASYIDKPPVCSDACIGMSYEAMYGAIADFGPLTDFFTPAGVDAFTFWQPELGQLDPGTGVTNELMLAMRAGSPAYAAPSLLAPRALSLLNEADGHYDPDARQVLLDKLASLGVSPVGAPSNSLSHCGHMTYLDATKPECGLDVLLPELAAAFSGSASGAFLDAFVSY